ncbi:prion-inhibition and propagation-domain-containing protein [Dactylonectria macrodidyma]|uniref:Prion-inhibition and propagation-domain-containing protein n=1 Tax=Dactylonectria macrodidyma TaxID=307937 RepID=A0A9P9DH67_9HYPO|nr:prion-inhibition and propagation-domain-containing protein [Dactylonectria macrodidyma]
MAEPVGTVLGVVSLATALSGTFVSVITCFEYLEFGRHFEKDFNKTQARLAALKLRITRWGIVAGAFPDPHTGEHRKVMADAETVSTASNLLNAIQADTVEVEEESKRYRVQPVSASSVDLSVLGRDDMHASVQALNVQTNVIVTRRVKGVSLTRRTRWALYEKKRFDRLLDDISENFGQLEDLFPQLVESLRELCRVEAEEVRRVEDDQVDMTMELLRDASEANSDRLLEQAVRETIISRGSGHRWEKTTMSDYARLHQGDHIASGFRGHAPTGRIGHNFGVTVGMGRSEIKQGDIYGSDATKVAENMFTLTVPSKEEEVLSGAREHSHQWAKSNLRLYWACIESLPFVKLPYKHSLAAAPQERRFEAKFAAERVISGSQYGAGKSDDSGIGGTGGGANGRVTLSEEKKILVEVEGPDAFLSGASTVVAGPVRRVVLPEALLDQGCCLTTWPPLCCILDYGQG